MLDTIEPHTFDELIAAEQLDPEPMERVAEVLKLGFAFVANMLRGNDGDESIPAITPADFEPYIERRKDAEADETEVSDATTTAQATEVSPDQGAMFCAMLLGPPTNQQQGGMQWPRPSAT